MTSDIIVTPEPATWRSERRPFEWAPALLAEDNRIWFFCPNCGGLHNEDTVSFFYRSWKLYCWPPCYFETMPRDPDCDQVLYPPLRPLKLGNPVAQEILWGILHTKPYWLAMSRDVARDGCFTNARWAARRLVRKELNWRRKNKRLRIFAPAQFQRLNFPPESRKLGMPPLD